MDLTDRLPNIYTVATTLVDSIIAQIDDYLMSSLTLGQPPKAIPDRRPPISSKRGLPPSFQPRLIFTGHHSLSTFCAFIQVVLQKQVEAELEH